MRYLSARCPTRRHFKQTMPVLTLRGGIWVANSVLQTALGVNVPPRITRLLDEIETQFQRLYPKMSMTAILMELPVNLSDATGCGKSKMAASKRQIHLSQFVNKMATKFQWL